MAVTRADLDAVQECAVAAIEMVDQAAAELKTMRTKAAREGYSPASLKAWQRAAGKAYDDLTAIVAQYATTQPEAWAMASAARVRDVSPTCKSGHAVARLKIQKLQQWLTAGRPTADRLALREFNGRIGAPWQITSDIALREIEDEWQRAKHQVGRAEPVRRKPRRSLTEYNVLARDYLKAHPNAGPRAVKAALGCATGTVYKLPAFIAVWGERKRGRRPKVVSLTPEMASVATESGSETLAKLVREQQRDNRSHRVKTRDRM